jgi:nicotinamidase-related amidase
MSTLLNAASCSVLLFDPKKEHLDHIELETKNAVTRSFGLLEQALRRIDIPVHIVFVSKAPQPCESLSNLEDAPHAKIHVFGLDGSSWSSAEVAARFCAEGRGSLVLAGFWLETTITFAALGALAAGFDVFIVMDATPPRTAAARSPAINRLLQAGGVPTTTYQLIAEWTETTADPEERAALSAIVSTSSAYPR